MKKKRFLLVLMAAALLIASCGPAQTSSTEEGSNASTVQESTVDVSGTENTVTEESIVSSSDQSDEAASANKESSEAPSGETDQVIINDSEKYPPKITLSGNHDDHFIADELCYYEGEKFFLLIADGADLPGDLANNIALIIDALEEKTGLSFSTSHDLFGFDNSTVNYGYNPWEGFYFGQKIPIFIKVDHKGAGYISCASAEFANIYARELYSMDVWNSVPNFKNNPASRYDFVDYFEFAHELTHVLTQRHAILTKIMAEGVADYYGMEVVDSLINVSDEFKKSKDVTYFDDFVKDQVTEASAEEIFRKDYQDLSHAQRGDEYTLGRLISSFLAETYGDTFLKDYVSALEDAGFAYEDMVFSIDQDSIDKQTEVFKNLFGDDVFTKFGAYYNSLQ